jgi:hypothetical protein
VIERQAKALLGLTMLIGVSRSKSDGTWEQEQFFGTINEVRPLSDSEFVDRYDGYAGQQFLVIVGCDDGIDRNYPFDADTFSFARPGEYTLSDSGRTIIDPDILCTWTVESPQ